MNQPTILLAGTALALAAAVALDRWNRRIESAVALPARAPDRRHPSIPAARTVRAPAASDPRQAVAPETREEAGERTFFEHAEASLALSHPDTPKVFCTARTRSARTGYVVSSCSVHEGHDGAHRDMHTGATWAARS